MRKRTKYIYTATTLENLSKGHHHDNITYRRLDHIPLEELFSRNMKAKPYWKKKQNTFTLALAVFYNWQAGRKNHY